MGLSTVAELLEDELKDLYSAETQLVKALPKMAKAASSEVLKEAITSHLEETKGHVDRLDRIGKELGIKLTGMKCKAMEGLIEEGKEILEEDERGPVVDLAIIGAAQRVEHYEISAYGTTKTLAQHLGHDEVVRLLEETEEEESAADTKLTAIAVDEVLPSASADEEQEEEGQDEDGEPKNRANNGKSKAKVARRR
jgi:ferritin-like metal-binding protein YciE